MKLRESVQRYSVGKHGSEYVDYSGPAMICPECQGTNVREVTVEDGSRSGDYLCNDCGCEFDTWIGGDLTKAGKIVSNILKALCVIFILLAILCLIGGLAYSMHLDSIYPDGSCPKSLEIKAIVITLVGPIVCAVIGAIAGSLEEGI